jgi:hypothetical protein
MSAYNSGSVTITLGDRTVVGNKTAFSINASANDLFKLNRDKVYSRIETINSATNLTLEASYCNTDFSATGTFVGMSYNIVTDYTTNYNLPEVTYGDSYISYTYTKAMREIDNDLYYLSN